MRIKRNTDLCANKERKRKPKAVKEIVEQGVWTSKQKTTFRRRKEWTDFRKQFLKDNPSCIMCGVKSATVHHKYKLNYDNLDKNRFLALCRTCHRFAHRFGQLHDRTQYTNKIKDVLKAIDFGMDWIKN